MKNKRSQFGFTLIETLLTLVVMAFIIIFVVRQYLIMQEDANVLQIQRNIETIFNLMAKYYRINCYGEEVAGREPPLIPGTLNPLHDPRPVKPFPINIENDLLSLGMNPIDFSKEQPFIDQSVGYYGYFAQFNYSEDSRNICKIAAAGSSGSFSQYGCTSRETVGLIVQWRPQVTIALKDEATARLMAKRINADCITSSFRRSEIGPGALMLACRANDRRDRYVAWQKTVSAITQDNALYKTQPFNQLYTTYPITYLINKSPTTGRIPDGSRQYYLCGG